MLCDYMQAFTRHKPHGFGKSQLQGIFVCMPLVMATLTEDDYGLGRILPRSSVALVEHVMDVQE
jgi:hypothetical protein